MQAAFAVTAWAATWEPGGTRTSHCHWTTSQESPLSARQPRSSNGLGRFCVMEKALCLGDALTSETGDHALRPSWTRLEKTAKALDRHWATDGKLFKEALWQL